MNIVWDNAERPLFAGLIGVTEIETFSDFDPDFHWPYVNEIEVYGFSEATAYIAVSTDEEGVVTYDNTIMYFENYMDSGFDMGRRTYIPADAKNLEAAGRQDLFRVEIEFYTHDRRRNDDEWMDTLWWESNDAEITRYTTSFYRDAQTKRDNLPLLIDLPEHTIYYDNEDFFVEYTVPDANSIRAYFTIFDLQPDANSDFIQFYDKDGNLYGGPDFYGRPGDPFNLENQFGPWINGDTLVIRFHSDGFGNSLPPDLYQGFKVGRVEIRR